MLGHYNKHNYFLPRKVGKKDIVPHFYFLSMAIDPEIGISNMNNKLIAVSYLSMI
jgi:hypothetical protein